MNRPSITRLLTGFVPFAFILSGCTGATPCRPTVTSARNAATADATDVNRSAVLEARLTSARKPVSSRTLWFRMIRDGRRTMVGSPSTRSDGVATVDLKNGAFIDQPKIALATSYEVVFSGDGTYCGSVGQASYSVANAPVVGRVGLDRLPPLPVHRPPALGVPKIAPRPCAAICLPKVRIPVLTDWYDRRMSTQRVVVAPGPERT